MYRLKIIEKIHNHTNLAKGVLYSAFAFFGRGVGFILLVILANYIVPEDYGKLSLYNTFGSVVALVMGCCTSGYFSISYFQNSFEEFKKDFTSITLIYIGTFILLSFLLLFVQDKLSKFIGLPPYLLWIALVLGVLSFFFSIHQDWYRIREQIWKYGACTCGNAVGDALFSIIFVIFCTWGWMGRIYSSIVCTVILAIFSIVIFARENLFTFDFSKERFKKILLFGIPLLPHSSIFFLTQGCDQYILNYYFTTYEVGIFSFALNLTSVILMLGFSFNASNSIAIYKILGSKDIQEKQAVLKTETRNMFFIYLIASVGYTIIMTIIVPFAMPKYEGALPYFWILSVYGFLHCIYLLYCNYFFYYKKTKSLMYITFSTSILHLLLSLIFTKYSLYAPALIFVIIHAVFVFSIYHRSTKLLRINLC